MAQALDRAGMPYMVTGSVASSLQGEAADLGYLERWARELGVEEAWSRIIAEAKTL